MGLSNAAKVGIITLSATVLLATLILWKTEIFMVGQGYEVIASFDNIEGLTLGSEVRFRGSKVGKVTKIDPGPFDIKIYSVVEKDLQIPADSTLRVAYDGIVGMKFLEIRPGTSEAMYTSKQVLFGTRTAAIVDFIDIGAKNLVETRAILAAVRKIVENPRLQQSFVDAVVVADRTALEIEALTKELRETNKGIRDIVSDPKFQENIKGTIAATDQTLTSANKFFENAGKVNMRASGGVDLGTRANAVRGDIDIIQSERTYYRVGFGEGPTRQPGLLDLLLTNKTTDTFGFRLGVINSQLGGGMVLYPSPRANILADVYDINNPRPNWPKVRLGYEYELQSFMDLLVQADDLLNDNNRNYMFGIRVKPLGEKLF
jgi:hypothetical protein